MHPSVFIKKPFFYHPKKYYPLFCFKEIFPYYDITHLIICRWWVCFSVCCNPCAPFKTMDIPLTFSIFWKVFDGPIPTLMNFPWSCNHTLRFAKTAPSRLDDEQRALKPRNYRVVPSLTQKQVLRDRLVERGLLFLHPDWFYRNKVLSKILISFDLHYGKQRTFYFIEMISYAYLSWK